MTTIILTLVGCASEDYVGNEEYHRQNEYGMPISLNLVAAPQTRSVGGPTAAGYLNNNFVIYGKKTLSDDNQVVFNNYQANYGTNTAGTTTSNSNDWEYVGYKNLPNGVTTNVGVPAFSALTESGQANAAAVDQTIKYWDYSASKYEFFGYSLGGTGTTTSWATSTAMSPYTFDLSGTQAQLSACYISDLLTKVDMSAANTAVQLQFRKMESKVRIALYENIPGYSVKDVKFYPSEGGTPGTTAYLYDKSALTSPTATASLPSQGKYTVTYTPLSTTPGTSQQTPANITWTPAETAGNTSSVSFGVANPGNESNQWTDWAATTTERVDVSGTLTSPGTVFLGKTSSGSTKSPEVSVLPNPNGSDLYMKVDYTLVALDGYGETIKVTGATATVPAAYAAWKPNCEYTYLFKISDNTNGSTGQMIPGLSPITLDAVVNTNVDGKQETITTVTEPSITTYQYRSKSDETIPDEYYASTKVVETEPSHTAGPIYIVVTKSDDGVVTLTTEGSINAKLYTVTNVAGTGAAENPAQEITEESVANVLTKTADGSGNYVVTDANKWIMTVSPASGLTAISEIDADDAPDGNAITINGAKFSPTAGTTYVFEYIYTTTDPTPVTKKAYKVIKVASGS